MKLKFVILVLPGLVAALGAQPAIGGIHHAIAKGERAH
jgi:hypothetical protein